MMKINKIQHEYCGIILRQLRQIKGLNQEEAAKVTGIDPIEISRLETGRTKKPKVEIIKKICEGYEIDFEDFQDILDQAHENKMSPEETLLLCEKFVKSPSANKTIANMTTISKIQHEYCAIILKQLRQIKGLNIKESAKVTGIDPIEISRLETGRTKKPKVEVIKKICEGYEIDFKGFIKILNESYKDRKPFEEVCLLCLENEIRRELPRPQIKEEQIDKVPGMIITAMRTVKRLTEPNEYKGVKIVLSSRLSQMQTNESIITDPEIFKQKIKFFKMAEEDLNLLYEKAIKENLTYTQILYYCLNYDINKKLLTKQSKPAYQSPEYDFYIKRPE